MGTGDTPTFTGLLLSGLTASQLVATDASKNLQSLAVATYPSLTELSYVKGVTSAIQTQFGLKAPSTAPTFATSITGSYLTASEILITDASKNIISAAVATYPSLTELTYVKGVTSAIQTQFTGKAATDQTMYIGTTAVAINRASAALTLAGITLTTPDIGTPSAGVLTNCSGLPLSGLVNSTTLALGIGSIELGHATDTTLSRVSAGVVAIEGVNIATISTTQTLTNKRITQREGTITDSATPTPASDDVDIYTVTALAQAATFGAPTGTPTQGQKLIIRVKDNATARALSWNAIYRAMGVSLPTTTTISKTLYCGFIYNTTDVKWDLIAKTEEA